MANRVPHPVVPEILGVFPAVGPDLPNLVIIFKYDQNPLRALYDLKRVALQPYA